VGAAWLAVVTSHRPLAGGVRARDCLVLVACEQSNKLTAANRCDRRGSVQRADAKWQAVHYISQVRQRRQQRYLAQTTEEAGFSGYAWRGDWQCNAMRCAKGGNAGIEAQDANALCMGE